MAIPLVQVDGPVKKNGLKKAAFIMDRYDFFQAMDLKTYFRLFAMALKSSAFPNSAPSGLALNAAMLHPMGV